MGAEIKITQGDCFEYVRDESGETINIFAEFLKDLAQKRIQVGKATAQGEVYKLMGNTFYGKLAQGLRLRKIRNIDDSQSILRPSKISCPHYAAMTTGIVRAALVCLVNEIASTPGCRVLSATTDGCMVVTKTVYAPPLRTSCPSSAKYTRD
jgi:hypothetical protein